MYKGLEVDHRFGYYHYNEFENSTDNGHLS